jgi:hypothetical protein
MATHIFKNWAGSLKSPTTKHNLRPISSLDHGGKKNGLVARNSQNFTQTRIALLTDPAKICTSGTKESQLTNPGLVKIVTFFLTL